MAVVMRLKLVQQRGGVQQQQRQCNDSEQAV